MSAPRILAFSGSLRTGSFNAMLLRTAVKGARAAGGEVTELSLADYPLPIYHGDHEASNGLPENARRLKAVFMEHDGLLLACPEYNSSIAPLMKNTIDWVSRAAPNEAGLAAFVGKVAALVSASPGGLGGLRGLRHMRDVLSDIMVVVLPAPFMVAVPRAHEAFDAHGMLKDAKLAAAVEAVGARLVKTVAAHRATVER
ncbi:MAG: NAD(P)H-dependent oxidoreductase [Phycisphaerales bacterium]